MGRVSVLPQIEPLPGSEGAAAMPNRHIDTRLRQDAADMRGHVIRTLCGMRKQRIAIGNLPGHECLQISQNGWVCILA